jgi:small multidrug resistance pump
MNVKWLMLAGAIGSEVTASLSLKAALDQPAWYAAVAVGFLAAFVFLAGALRAGMALGVAYGIWGALGVALTAVFGAVLFGEPLTALMGVGIALIMGGVVTIELGSQRAAAREPQEVNA